MERRNLGVLSAVVVVLGASVGLWSCMGDDDGGFDARSAALLGTPVSGAIFTTRADGSAVDANIYEAKGDVYLDGGPGPRAPASAGGLPPGDYYFQVTDPGGRDLLSEDHISCRRVRVNDAGVIDYAYPGTNYVRVRGTWTAVPCQHLVGVDVDHVEVGAITVQLMPYADTPNRGGVYKAWMTPVEDYLGDPSYVPSRPGDSVAGERWEPGNFHGFAPSSSKTDNYKINRRGGPPYEPPMLSVRKWHDADLDGARDDGEEEITGWMVTVADPIGSSNNYFTPASIFATQGTWTAFEDHRAGTLQTGALLDGAIESAYPFADPMVAVTFDGSSAERHEIWYGNVGLGLVTVCKRYDRDADGVTDEGEPSVTGWSMELSGTTVTGTGVGPLRRETGSDGCVHFADLLPGDYHVTEHDAPAPWHHSGESSFDVEVVSTLGEGGVLTGTARRVSFTNYCTGTADFGTKGYWHNRNGLAEITPADIAFVNGLAPYATPSTYFEAGDEPFDGHFADGAPVPAANGEAGELAAPAGTALAEISHFLVDANAGGDPREQLAQQLLAFVFNTRHRLDDPGAALTLADGTSVTAAALIERAVTLWSTGTAAEQQGMASTLDAFNQSDALEYVRYTPCDVPVTPPVTPDADGTAPAGI